MSVTGNNAPIGNTFTINTKIINNETITSNFNDPRY